MPTTLVSVQGGKVRVADAGPGAVAVALGCERIGQPGDHGDGHPHADGHPHTDGHADSDSDGEPDAHADADHHADADGYAHADGYPDSDAAAGWLQRRERGRADLVLLHELPRNASASVPRDVPEWQPPHAR